MPTGKETLLDALVETVREGGDFAEGGFSFGMGVAQQTSADVGIMADADAKRGSSGEAPDVKIEPNVEVLSAMNSDERIERIRESVERHPRHRELEYLIMAYVGEHAGASYEEVEKYIAELPQFASSLQSERILIAILERAGALESDGSDDGALTLTEAGQQFEASFTPEARLKELFDEAEDDQVEAYEYLLKACAEQKRTFEELDAAVQKLPAVRFLDNGQMAIYPSTYIDRLEKAAGLRWELGWVTTDAGKAYVK